MQINQIIHSHELSTTTIYLITNLTYLAAIDNPTERPMKVEIALDPSQLQTLASRVSAPPVSGNRGGAPARGAARGGRGGGRGGAKPRTARPKPKTAEELDAEMSVSLSLFSRMSLALGRRGADI